MHHRFNWSEEQKRVLEMMELPFDFSNVPDEEIIAFTDMVGDYLQMQGIGDDDELNEIGLTCETILDELSKA